MALSDKWWICCVLSLICVARLGSCEGGRPANGALRHPYIFQEFCALKDEPGTCKAIKERFFFNVNTGKCDVFEYGGCGGNANNFETFEKCEEECVITDTKSPCHLPEAPGPCRGLVTRYFFDNKIRQCKHFFYGGCFGNANNFMSMAACRAKCQNPEKPTPAPEVYTQAVREIVQPTVETRQQTHFKSEMQPNGTNQETKEFPDKDVCSSPIKRGTCNGAEKRFAYNARTKRCQLFSYSGCGGNGNNFPTRRHCFRKCNKNVNGMIRVKRKNLHNFAPRSA